jgi:hypothetical protein
LAKIYHQSLSKLSNTSVAVMKPAKDQRRDIGRVGLDNPTQMPIARNHRVVKTFTPDRADQPLLLVEDAAAAREIACA